MAFGFFADGEGLDGRGGSLDGRSDGEGEGEGVCPKCEAANSCGFDAEAGGFRLAEFIEQASHE